MIRNRIAALSMLVSLSMLGAGPLAAQRGYDLFQQALVKERAEGKLEESIQILQRITREYATDRTLVAKSLLAIGQQYEKLNRPEARTAYGRLVTEYAEQRAQVADARVRLVALDARAAQVGQTTRLISTDIGKDGNTDVGLSANGRYLSFTGGPTGLAVLDLSSGRTIQVRNPGAEDGYVESSVVSPDGRQVAYIWDMGSTVGEELRVLPVLGGNATRGRSVYLNQGYMGVHGWSPDGKSVVVVREREDGTMAEIAVISIADGAVRVLRSNLRAGNVGGAHFSPDGQFVVYHARASATGPITPPMAPVVGRDIFVLPAGGGEERRVVESPSDDREPLWSPDGSHLVFLSNRTGNASLWMVPVAGGAPSGTARLVKDNVGRLRPLGMSRSGVLHYIDGSQTSNVYTADLDARLNAASPAKATDQYVNANRGGTWSPDGQSLAYLALSPRGVVIRIRSLQSGEDREVPTQMLASGSPRWFPDGQSLLVASRDPRLLNGQLGYYRVSVTRGNAELLHQTASPDVVATRPDLSPDGKTIFFLETPLQTVRFDIDSRRETRLPATTAPFLSLAVSPDGAQLALVGSGSVAVAPAAGGAPRDLVRFSGRSSPLERADGLGLAWSADQRSVFFVKPDVRVIWRVAVSGGEPENIGVSMNRIRALRVHPGGRRIVFDSVIDAPSELWVLEDFLPKAAARR